MRILKVIIKNIGLATFVSSPSIGSNNPRIRAMTLLLLGWRVTPPPPNYNVIIKNIGLATFVSSPSIGSNNPRVRAMTLLLLGWGFPPPPPPNYNYSLHIY